MKNVSPDLIIEIIERYENIDRDVLACNLRSAMSNVNKSIKQQDSWLSNLSGYKRKTIYTWMSPHRNEKVPLKLVAIISKQLDIPITVLMNPTLNNGKTQLRKQINKSTSCANKVIDYWKSHPNQTVKEIAEAVGLSTVTVRRHIKNHMKGNKKMYEVQTKPKIRINLDSPDGNIYFILAHAVNAMKTYNIVNAKEKAAEMREKVKKSHDYEEALEIIRGYVDIIED